MNVEMMGEAVPFTLTSIEFIAHKFLELFIQHKYPKLFMKQLEDNLTNTDPELFQCIITQIFKTLYIDMKKV